MNYESDNFLDNEQIELSPSNNKKEGDIVKFYLNIVKRKIILIIIFTVLGFIPAFLVSRKDPVIYSAKFELLLEPVSTEEKLTDASILTRSGGTVDENLLRLDYPTVLRLLKSSLVLSEIAKKINQKHPDITEDFIIQKLQKNLIVERAKASSSRLDETKIIEVTFETDNPELAEIVLESTAETFLEYSVKEREKTLSYGVNFIDEQIPKIQLEIKNIQKKQKQLQLKYKLINPETQGNALFQNKIAIEQDLTKTIRELKEAEILADKLQKDLGLSSEESLIASSLNEDPERQLLVTEIEKIKAEIAIQSAIFTDEFPSIKNLKDKLNNLTELLNKKNQEILKQKNININKLNPNVLLYQDRNRLSLITTLIETQNKINILSTRQESLKKLQQSVNQELAIIPDVIEEYNELERKLILNTSILNTLSTQKETLNVEAAQKKSPWQLISEPKIPKDENNNFIGYPPNPKKKLIAGLGAGFMLGCLIAILLEKKADIFYEDSDIEYCFGKPILGKIKLNSIFNSDHKKLNSDTINEDISDNQNGSAIFNITENSHNNGHEKSKNVDSNKLKVKDSEEKSFKELSVNLHFQLSKITPNYILISSLSSEDNQDFVVANLAKKISQLDKKVLLIDLDSKNSQIKSFFEADNEENLVSFLRNSDEEEDTIQIIQPIDNYDNLVIFNTEELDIKDTINLVHAENFDLILYNGSFFLENYELSLLAEKTEGILMVVKIKSTPLSSLQEAVKRIKDYKLNLLGFVVIDEQKI